MFALGARPYNNYTASLSLECSVITLRFFFSSQIERMQQFFVVDGLPHLMFYYQDTQPVEAGNVLVSNIIDMT